jgi:hypothetical protein
MAAPNSHLNPTKNINQASKDMKNNNYLFAATALAALMTGAVANAAITVSSQSSASKIAFDDTGTEIGGVSFTTAATYDGIAFSNWTGNVTTATTFGASSVSIVGTASFGTNRTGIGGIDQYTQVTYTSGNAPGSFSITGLDMGKTYRVQYGFVDTRNGSFPYSVTTTLTLSDASFATQSLSIGATGTADDYELIAAEVSGTTSLLFDLPQAGNGIGPAISSFSVHEIIPEPSAALLGGIGLLALLRRRRA